MPALAEKHIHKLKRLQYKSGNAIYFCVLPDCNYKTKTPLALGKRSICWRCGEEFIMDEYSVRLAKPHCFKCHKPKSSEGIIEVVTGKLVPLGPGTDLMDRLQSAIETAKAQTEEEDI